MLNIKSVNNNDKESWGNNDNNNDKDKFNSFENKDSNNNNNNKVKFNSHDNTVNNNNNYNYNSNSNGNRYNIKNKDNTTTNNNDNNSNINKNDDNNPKTGKQLKRKIIWFNPLFSKNVATKVGQYFLNLTDKHFPRDNKFPKIFNRKIVKVSYSCMSNIK